LERKRERERERERIIKAAENLGSIKYRCPCLKPTLAYKTSDLHIQLGTSATRGVGV